MKKFRKNSKGVSPVLSVLMMITVAVAASLVTYAWVMGYLGFTTAKAGKAVQIQSVAWNQPSNGQITVYVQNVGDGTLKIKNIFVNNVLKPFVGSPDLDLSEGEISGLTVSETVTPGAEYTFRVVCEDGTFMELTKAAP
jgi:FlaG/FlaF family flagellin (archaellin)